MPKTNSAAYEALGPFFEIVMKGLNGLVDGDHYFDTFERDRAIQTLPEFYAGLFCDAVGSPFACIAHRTVRQLKGV
jgi:hypothetical protein